MLLENYHEDHNEKQKEIENKIETIEQRKEQLLQKENISQEELEEIKEEIYSEIDKKAEVAEHVDDYCLLSIANEIKAVNVELSLEKKQEIYHTIEDVDSEIIQARIDAKKEIEDLLKTEMPVSGTIEFRERQKVVFDDINQRASNVKLDEFTYFEELDEYIDKNPLFKEDDKINANTVLSRIKDRNPEIKKTAIEYIKDINNKQNIKNLFRSYLMINRLVGQKETSITNSLNNISFEDIVVKSKNIPNIFNLNVFSNSDIQEYLKQNFNPKDYKQNYKEFTEQRLLNENKDNIKKYIKIQTIINSKEWQEMWNTVV